MLVLDDNLKFMSTMNADSVDLIATDPPFNTGTERGHYNDAFGSVHDYIDWLRPRLVEMHRVLKSTGSIYVHCDWRSNAYIRVCMDDIFGGKNFVNEIVWCYGGRGMSKRWFNRKHDTIFFYTKSDSYTFNSAEVSRPVALEHMGRYDQTDETGRKYANIKNDDGSYSQIFLKDDGVVLEDFWNIPYVRGNESVGSSDQKPLALYERIVKASSNDGDLVLDPFCGSGTTLVAAQRMHRRYIGIDSSAEIVETAKNRLQQRTML